VSISARAKISKYADIETSVRGSTLSIGDNSVIDSFVKIKFCGGSGNISIGSHCYINSGCVLYSGNGITIGNDVLIASNCTFAPVNHAFSSQEKPIRQQGFLPSRGGIVIEDDCWIGANVVILDGTHIAKGCVIGASSLVKGQLEPYGIYGGNPLKFIRMRDESNSSRG